MLRIDATVAFRRPPRRASKDQIHLSRAFWDEYGEPSAGWWGAMVTLKDPAELGAFRRCAGARTGRDHRLPDRRQEHRSHRPHRRTAVALSIRLIAAILGLVLIGQAISRRLRAEARDNQAWSSMGDHAPRCDVDVTVAALGSPDRSSGRGGRPVVTLTPVGPVRDAEPHPASQSTAGSWRWGRSDWRSQWSCRGDPRLARRVQRDARPVLLAGHRRDAGEARSTARSRPVSGSPSIPVGSQLGSHPLHAHRGVERGRHRGRGGGDRHEPEPLVATPRLYGSDWDALISFSGANADIEESRPASQDVVDALDDDPAVAAWSPIAAEQVEIDGGRSRFAFLDGARPIEPTIAAGRAPDGADEIALGQLTMDQLGVEVGDVVEVAVTTVQSRRRSGFSSFPPWRSTRLRQDVARRGGVAGRPQRRLPQANDRLALAVQLAPGEWPMRSPSD